MRLYNEKGTFDLPDGFALSLERTNPFFTDEGDTSVPVTLPSSPHNLLLLGHIERIDAKDDDLARAEAWLTVDAITVKGTLLVDALSQEDGIDAAFTFRNGGLYAEYKDKPLKELFAAKVEDLLSPREAALHLQSVYNAASNTRDYTCFPVMGQASEACVDGYSVINQVSGSTLVHAPRTFYAGSTLLHVPEGYGVTPFLYLHRLLEIMFEEFMHYTVTANVFANLTRKLVVLNNTIDAIVDGKIHYADMVPAMTVSELLTWLRDRFMVQAVVDSNAMTVKIVTLESMTKPDADLTGLLESGITMRYERPSHVVVTPTVGEGNEAAAPSLKALKEKYGAWVGVDENDWDRIAGNNNPTYYDCLILRRATGMFHEMRRDLVTGAPVLHGIGSNCLAYDRENNDQAEAYSPADVMPLMVCTSKRELYPVIGDPIHRHSTYSGMGDNSDQRLIIVKEYDGISNAVFNRGGTTQDNVPVLVQTSTGYLRPIGAALTPDGLYETYWSRYNNILLGGKRTATMRVGYDTPAFLTVDMANAKLCRNQLLLPLKSRAEIGGKMRNGESEFLVSRFDDLLDDQPIAPGTISRLRWVINNSAIADFVDSCLETNKYYDEDWNEVGASGNWKWWSTQVIGTPEISAAGADTQIYIGPPQQANDSISFSVRITVKVTIRCSSLQISQNFVTDHEFTFYSGDLTVTFTSETY